jgi:tRNA pseudouridine55 synthase
MGSADAIAVIDKPLGMTSHDVVSKLRKFLNTRKIGHAGTLDPQASGVLVLGVNRGTRLMQYFVGDDKRYQAQLRLGVATVSDDADGEVIAITPTTLTAADILPQLKLLTGEIMQRPSSVSAIKVNGKRAHDLVRAGVDLVLPERPVTVHSIELLDVKQSQYQGIAVTDISIAVHCSSGTYVRALARDLGNQLGVGGSVLTLCRTQAGVFDLAEAQPIPVAGNQLAMFSLGEVAKRILPWVIIDEMKISDLVHGRQIDLNSTEPSPIAVLDQKGELVAVGNVDAGKFQPSNVFMTVSDVKNG